MGTPTRKDSSENVSGTIPIAYRDENGLLQIWVGDGSAPYIKDLDYDVTIGPTISVSLTTASAVSTKLAPGRYFVQALGLLTNRAYVIAGPYNSVTPPVATATNGMPFDVTGFIGCEIQVTAAVNDQIAGIMSASTATLYITSISKPPPSRT